MFTAKIKAKIKEVAEAWLEANGKTELPNHETEKGVHVHLDPEKDGLILDTFSDCFLYQEKVVVGVKNSGQKISDDALKKAMKQRSIENKSSGVDGVWQFVYSYDWDKEGQNVKEYFKINSQ